MLILNKKEFFLLFLNCRRGMLELDVLLLNFLDARYYDLSHEFIRDFSRMLLESDNNLHLWLIKRDGHGINCFYYIIAEINKVSDMFDFN